MKPGFEFITDLQYKVRSLTARVDAFTTGEKYVSMKAEFESRLAHENAQKRKLKAELSGVRREYAAVRKNWSEVIDDIQKDHEKQLREKDREIEKLLQRALKAERQRDEAKDMLREKMSQLYQVKTELEDVKGKNQKLISQINRDYENSSISSSLKPNRKKITNNREKTGRKPGGQPGHAGHRRKQLPPTNSIYILPPPEYLDIARYKPTGKTITKQLISLSVNVRVDEYFTAEFRDVHTGQRVHAEFPHDMVNEVNYGGSVKAFAFLLNNHCNVSIIKTSDFLSELTDGQLKISAGMINGLSKEFSLKTEADQKKAFADMFLAPVVNTDFTSARVNGRNMHVMVCATPDSALYFAREHKGHEGVKETPVEEYQGILSHDHDKTFYAYGRAHQECLEHILRYLKDSIDNEPDLKWNRKMQGLLKEMIHFRNGLDPDDERNPDQINPDVVSEFEARYDKTLELAAEEYDYEPPGKYYRDGFNLYKRLAEYRAAHLLFLHDARVFPTNNLAERLLRIFKRKQQQAMTFRSFDGLKNLCNVLGVFASLRAEGKNLYTSVAEIFD